MYMHVSYDLTILIIKGVFSTVNTLSWCKNLPSFKQQNDHKKYKYYTAIKHTADLKNKEVLLIEVWAYKYSVMLHGVNLLAKKKHSHAST